VNKLVMPACKGAMLSGESQQSWWYHQ